MSGWLHVCFVSLNGDSYVDLIGIEQTKETNMDE